MKIQRIAELFSAFNSGDKAPQARQAEEKKQQVEAENPEAVKIRMDFAKDLAPTEAELAQRRERVEYLKEQVASGKYRPDTTAVAKAVASELLI